MKLGSIGAKTMLGTPLLTPMEAQERGGRKKKRDGRKGQPK